MNNGNRSYIYILSNKYNTTFYIGVTSNIEKRLWQHRQGQIPGFTQRYSLHKLIYYEEYYTIIDAIAREKQLKNWHRDWKLNLIRSKNPNFDDLSVANGIPK